MMILRLCLATDLLGAPPPQGNEAQVRHDSRSARLSCEVRRYLFEGALTQLAD